MNREELFDTLTRGMTPRRIAKALGELTPGINWYGSTKASMRNSFCHAPAYCPYLDKVSAEEFKAALDKHRGVVPRHSVVPTPPPMKVFYTTQFDGHWPVGASAVVVAESHEAAAKALEAELRSIGLPQTLPPNAMIELEMQPQVVVLQDGNY